MRNRALDAVLSLAWAIHEPALATVLDVAQRAKDDPGQTAQRAQALEAFTLKREAVAAKEGRPLDGTEDVTVRDGVAVVPVIGIISRYMSLFTWFSGGTAVDVLAKDFRAALDDPQVRAILLAIDSPGGEVNGIAEMAGMIRDAAAEKPVVAYVSDFATSGAYWLASAAEEIVIAPTATLGSIGVVAAVRPPRGDRIEFVSSQSPGKRPDPTTESGRQQIQQYVDDLAAVFVSAVAEHRDVSEETVLADFGRGGLLVGQDAVDAGTADRIGSFESVLSELVDRTQDSAPGYGLPMRAHPRALAGSGTTAREKRPMKVSDIAREVARVLRGQGTQVEDDIGSTAPSAALVPGAAPLLPLDTAARAENERLKAELEQERQVRQRLEAQRKVEAEARIKSDAEAFVAAERTAKRVMPAEEAELTAQFIRAATDDLEHPLAGGEPSRVALLRATQAKRPAHSLTSERVQTQLPPGAVVLPTGTGSDAEQQAKTAYDRAAAYARRANGSAPKAVGNDNGKGA